MGGGGSEIFGIQGKIEEKNVKGHGTIQAPLKKGVPVKMDIALEWIADI